MSLFMALSCSFKTFVFKRLNLRLQSCFYNTYLNSRFFKMALNANTAYFQTDKENEKLSVQVMFHDQSYNLERTFHFERNMSECIDKFLTLLSQRVEDSLIKKTRKKKRDINSEEKTFPTFSVESNFFFNEDQIPRETLLRDLVNEKSFDNLKLKIFGIECKTVLNCPMVILVTLPKNIRVNCPVTPKKLVTQSCDIHSCKFIWYTKSINKNEWIQCGSGYSYMPNKKDLGLYIKLVCIPMNNCLTGPKSEVIASGPVEDFENGVDILQRQKFTLNKTLEDEIRVVTYNLLADVYTNTKEAKTILYKNCNRDILDFEYRMGLIFLELEGYNADIFCLQEVEKKFYTNHLDQFLYQKGFNGFYTEKEGCREGCALFYNVNKFEILDKHQHFLSEELINNPLFSDINEKIKNNSNLIERIKGISTLIQIAVLKCVKRVNDIIVVGNSHLYFHPDADHIRLLQGIVAFKILIQKMQEIKNKDPNKNLTLLWCGDFNSTPDCGIYKFLTQGSISEEENDWKSCSTEVITNVSYSHSLKMSSACGILPYTNYTELFKACLDYIYYQTDRLKVTKFVPLPSEEILKKETALPSSYFPSDHLAIIADLKWKS